MHLTFDLTEKSNSQKIVRDAETHETCRPLATHSDTFCVVGWPLVAAPDLRLGKHAFGLLSHNFPQGGHQQNV